MNGTAIGARRQTLLVLLWTAIVLLSVEVLARVVTPALSGNLAHVARIPALVSQAAGAAGPAMVVIGNSLTNNGVDADMLAREVPGVHFAKVTPDGTSLWDWQCILRRQLLPQGRDSVRYVVVGTAWHLLSDQTDADPSRLGGLYCGYGDLLHPARTGVSGSADTGEFITARTLRLYALRDTLRNRMFSTLVPHYRRFVSEDNQAAGGQPARAEANRYTYRVFAELVAALEARGVRVVVIGMPVREQYEIADDLSDLARSGRILLLDYRQTPGIMADSFVDSMHLGPQGSVLLTRRLAADLAQLDPGQ